MRGLTTLALLLWSYPGVAEAAGEPSLGGYLTRMALALCLLAAVAWGVVRYLPQRVAGLRSGPGKVKVLCSQALGRDALYVLRIGPDVVAVLSGRNGSQVLGRWSLSEWEQEEAETDEATS